MLSKYNMTTIKSKVLAIVMCNEYHLLVYVDSPMLLDTTIETQQQDLDTVMEERANIILSVPEYADDIYSYLREAEVRVNPLSHGILDFMIPFWGSIGNHYYLKLNTK